MSATSPEMDYRSTVLLPKTDFPQRGNLPEKEPEFVKRWTDSNLASQIEKRPGRTEFVLHDGPPYANGNIHIGHALNKVLKDLIVRFKNMSGHRVRYVPGWDCHGLPIEQKVVDDLMTKKQYEGKKPLEIRRLCADYARHWQKIQSEQFQRLGITGDWDHPYMTLDPTYEVAILQALKSLQEQGFVYRGLRSVLWDPIFETALAEAEIEYNEAHVSQSIYVRMPLDSEPSMEELRGASIVIWTTTPWTMPANMGVCLHPEFDYVVYRTNGERIVVAKGLLEEFLKVTGLPSGEVLAEFRAEILEKLYCKHPIFPGKKSLIMLAGHVTLEQGTGAVHTAPGHGVDDFNVGREYGLEIFCPVDARGRYTSDYPEMQGEFVFAANPKIVEKLRAEGTLLFDTKITHSYPYSWRSRKPVIYRATDQWFMAVDKDGLRERALAEIENVNWVPHWGYDRINAMVSQRPDWCLSRQRSWGVPIPAIRDTQTGESLLLPEVIDRVCAVVKSEGTDAWFARPVEDFLPDDLKAHGPGRYEKQFDILDVWFDSGSSHLAVLNEAYGLSWPADIYVEGSDQHRGWFQLSLWVSMGVKGKAPFRTVLTHGFVLDEKGIAMSKSLGNVISPLDVIKESGADVLRMWVASEDYRRDLGLGKGMLQQCAGVYRRFRNTVRFLLGNLDGFNPATDRVTHGELLEEDRYLLHTLYELVEHCNTAYNAYEFHRVFHEVNNFCVTDLGAGYLDWIKDRVYCAGAKDLTRRAAQTVVFEVASTLLRLFAPITPFTSEEAWDFLPAWNGKEESVHLASFPTPKPEWKNDPLAEKFTRFLALRDVVNLALEELRKPSSDAVLPAGIRIVRHGEGVKEIGSTADASVTISTVDAATLMLLRENGETLRRVLQVSLLTVEESVPDAEVAELASAGLKLALTVGKAQGNRCARCWHYRSTVGADQAHPALCDRCADVVRRMVL